MPNLDTQEKIHDLVRERYGAIAEGNAQSHKTSSCCGPTSCGCSDASADADRLAKVVGYSAQELSELPEGANLGLSCGNPLAIASLKAGDTVLDLGSGAGFDAFLAGRAVGASGKVIGVDMTSSMLSKARAATAAYRERSGLDNVEFRLGEIEALPLADNSVDVVISNCVLNLSPDKSRVFREIFRVLKTGGRVAISDLALREPLPPAIVANVEALVGCVAGAALVEDNHAWARHAGLSEIAIQYKDGYVDALSSWKDPLYQAILASLPKERTLGDYIVSIVLSARKLPAPCGGSETRGCCGGVS